MKLLATPATMAPMVKKTRVTRMSALRPKMSEREAKLGWKTVEVRRKEVPDQKASIALPRSFSEMICGLLVMYWVRGGRRDLQGGRRRGKSRQVLL